MSEELGAIIRAARHHEGLTQRALGDEAGISKQHISSIERGRLLPSITTLVRLGRVLGNHLLVDVIRQVQREVR
jgi:UDP-N-acetylglucosamine 1-carboxyvinyltransferase